MAASGFEARNGEKKLPASRTSVAIGGEVDEAVPYAPNDGADSDSLKPVYDYTHRRLRYSIDSGMAEMVTYLPISSPFIRFAGRFVDEAFGVAAGYNFFVLEAMLVPFEVVACNLVIHYWTEIIPTGAMVAMILILYAIINIFAVKWYGEAEFWLSLGKVVLAIGLILYTFVTMLGGNPLDDRYGFRYWKDPGAFAEAYDTGSLGRFIGFLVCLVQASYTISGPDYVSMAAGEAENPRVVMPRAYNKVFGRLTAFFVLGSLAVGINVPYNSPELAAAFERGEPGAAASPYVISMIRLRIGVLPDIVNALILTACFSAGNSYVYCASRALLGLALERRAPRIFTRCLKNGVPIYCVLFVLLISLISFLQVSSGTATVLRWLVSIVRHAMSLSCSLAELTCGQITASQLINFAVITFTYTRFRDACEAQGLSRDDLPYKGLFQPFLAWYAFCGCIVMMLMNGFTVFIRGNWQITTFFFCYTMVGVFPILYFGWKILKGTKIIKSTEVDLRKDVAEIEEYTRNYVPGPPG
ncbi:MAG: hypothetical protein LQ348_000404 [Seirophora lacunosa]|nr:MAG: hypothetical protein LQ348_000404 [Seirophora lacunosa]